jgi:signal transduction histidine kinase
MTSSASFLRFTLIMLALGVVVLMTIVGTSIWLSRANSTYSEQTLALRRVRSGIVDLFRVVQDAETGQRGYMLTGDQRYLGPYDSAINDIAAREKKLDGYIQNLPEYKARLATLNADIAGKMAELKKTVDLARGGHMADALALVKTDIGRNYMVDIRNTLDETLTYTDGRLQTLVGDQLNAANTLYWVIIGGAGAILLVAGGAGYVIFEHVQSLSHAREELDILNKGLELRVNERTRDLIRANQEIQRFAYIITHDLRAPLVNIMGFLSELDTALKDVSGYVLADGRQPTEDEILQARTAVREDVPEAIGFIRTSTKKMDGLINAILKISRDGRRKLMPERLDVETMLKASVDSIQHQVTASDGAVKIAVKLRSIVTDRISLEQVFGNLLDNAVKYRAPDRPIEIAIEVQPDGPGQCLISVSDNGRGISPDDHERIFELFRRSGEQDQPGEGIGLAYVRSLVRNLGGDINVQSEFGKGSTFVINLPTDLNRILDHARAG